MFWISFIIAMTSFSFASANSAKICSAKKQFLQQSLKPSGHIDFFDLLSEMVPKTQILLVGEHHIYSHRLIYSSVFRQIKKADPRYDCLFLEGNQNIAHAHEMSRIHGMVDALAVAKELNMQVIVLEPEVLGSWNARNDMMSLIIQENLTIRKCTKGIAIIGADHLINISKRLVKAEIPSKSIHFFPDKSYSIQTRDNGIFPIDLYGEIAEMYGKAFCTNEAPKLQTAIAFRARPEDPFDYFALYPMGDDPILIKQSISF